MTTNSTTAEVRLAKLGIYLPAATRTAIWEKAGTDIASLPPSIVMTVDDMVDAALVGLDRGEGVTIPSLPDIGDWEAYETARRNMIPKLSLSTPAMRYDVAAASVTPTPASNPIGER